MKKTVRFGELEVDVQAGCLYRRGVKVRLREQLFTVLSVLLERAGEVVTREELQRRLWPGGVVVDFEVNLNTLIARLREVLGDSAEHPRFIETLPKRGYRFMAALSEGPASESGSPRRIRLVVLPLTNGSGDPAEEYFCDAMTDELTTALCRAAPERLAVIARTTAMHYKGSEKDVARIGRELGVDYVVEGGVRRAGGQLAMNLQLIQAADQTHVFARKYDSGLHDLFKAMDSAAADVAGMIGSDTAAEAGPASLSTGLKARKKPTEDLAAYNEYILARYDMGKGSAGGFAGARQHLERALARDPMFALAYDALAEIDWYLGYFGYVPPQKAFAEGIGHALRAIELDFSRAETHALLGEFHKTLAYNWPEVHREMALALQLDPASPLVRLRYAISDLMPHGRLEEAIAELERSLESDPLSMLTQGWLGVMLVLAHRWERALDQADLLLQLYPGGFWGYFIMGVAYREKQMPEKAISALRTALELSGGMPGLIGWLGLTLGVNGNTAEARSLLEGLRAKAAQGHVPPTSFAWIHLGLGEIDAAMDWLDRAVDERDQFMMPIKSYRFFDPLRADPRFQALLRKMKLEP